ncbi:MAG TPA: porin [Rhodospirillaceae bacterium]|nr:porin [Rhodospirillaceae bacterium]
MKKLLLSTAACGLALALVPTPAAAQLEVGAGGHAKIYGVYIDQDEESAAATAANGDEAREIDMIRDTEVHVSGETTMDNGLGVGVHIEAETDGDEGFNVDESYVYFSGDWGRVNLGEEDGAAYLLQVAAPSADANIDGIRQYVQPINYAVLTDITTGVTTQGLDYDQDQARSTDNLTYLSPVFNGFQAGFTYAPDVSDNSGNAQGLGGVRTDNEIEFGSLYELALRYEGMFNNIGFILGGGYTHVDHERDDDPIGAGDVTDDRTAYNAGLDIDVGPFGIGAAYVVDDNGDVRNAANTDDIDEEETMVVGVDYTTGPFKIGGSYLDSENTNGNDDVDSQRYIGGVVYTAGPGLSFRGSIQHVEHEDATDEADATAVVVGTQVDF